MPTVILPKKRPLRFASFVVFIVLVLLSAQHFFSIPELTFQPSSSSATPVSPSPWQPSSTEAHNLTSVNNQSLIRKKDKYWPLFPSKHSDAWLIPYQEAIDNTSFLSSLQSYTQEGHGPNDLASLVEHYSQRGQQTSTANLTAIFHVTDPSHLPKQIDAVLSQSVRPTHLWVVCSTDSAKDVRPILQPHDAIRLFVIEEPTPWLALPPLDTEYAWVLESGVLPFSDQYLKHMVGLLNTPEYHDALLGSQATLLPSNFNGHGELVCFPEAFRQLPHVTQPVDTIHRSWLLRTSWIPLLLQDPVQGPLAFHISRALWFHGGIVSVALPDHVHYRLLLLDDRQTSCADMHHALNTDATWRALLDLRTTPAALDFRQVRLRAHKQLYTLAFVLDGPDQASALYPLMCSFDYTVHAIVTGRYRGLSGAVLEQTLATTGCERVIVHDLNLDPPDEHAAAAAISFGVRRLLQALASPPFVYVQGTGAVPRALEMMGDTLTAISLPIDQIEHALWLSKLPYRALQHWNTPEIDIVVVTDRRPHSLSRLIQSAERSYFLGDRVNLAIQMGQSSDRVTRMYVNSLQWVHGQKVVRHRIRKGGLMPAIIESWYPSNDDNYAVLLEDDVEVSPLFYVWAKYSILQYRYGDASQNARHLMFGVSLYSPRSVELNPEGRRPFHPDNVLRNYYPPRTPYASQIPCSWGAVYFPEHWREFHEYLTIRLLDLKQDRLLNITVPRSRSSRWKKSWKKYFIEMVYLRGYVMLYPNFQEFESFSTNHLETGTHIKTPEKRVKTIRDFLVPLMQRDTIVEQLPDHRLPMFDDLPVLDLWGLLATYPQLNDTGARWHQRVSTCVRKGLGQFDARDMVCPFPIPWETRQSMSASYSMSSESASLSRAMKSQTVYAVEPIDYVTYTGAYPADVVEDEEDYMPEAIDVAQMPSEPDDGSILDDDAELDLIRDLDHLPQIPLDLQEVLLADAEQDL